MTKNYVLTLIFSLFFFLSAEAQNCNPPTGLSVSSITGTSATLAWNPPIIPTLNEVYIVPAGASAPTNQSGMSAQTNSYVATGLVPCTFYAFYVRTLCGSNDFSQWAGPFNFSTDSGLTCTTTANGNTITTIVSGGMAPYQYALNGGPPIPGIGLFTMNVVPGTYTIQVTDASGCSCSSTITVLPSFYVNILAVPEIPVSSLFAQVVGGTAPYTYQWSYNGTSIMGANQNQLAINQAGTFRVTVTDANGVVTFSSDFVVNTPVANDDAFSVYPTDGNFATSAGSIFSNDITGMIPGMSMPIATVVTIPEGFILNPDGSVSVLSGTPSGVYTLVYQLCSPYYPLACDTATVVITVMNEGILMNAFIDTNNNGTQETGEPAFYQGQFGYELNDSGTVNYASSTNGNYLISNLNPANSYDLTYVVNPGVASQYTVAPASYTNISVVPNSGIHVYNFPVTEIPYYDLTVSVVPYNAPPRPGFVYYNMIIYSNNGNQAIASGTVTFNKDNAVAIVNVSPVVSTATATGFTYNFTNLLPGETRYLYVSMQVPTIPTVELGNILTNNASVTVPAGDINISNNTGSLSQTIVGSYDPNDKSEAHGGKIVYSDFTSNDYLTYTIQFENTGNFSAENVSIVDDLNEKLDETSVKMTSASHGYTLNRTGNHLNWSFIGIDLPPSVANTTTGKGYVTFQVKPKAGYAIGDIIPNFAGIFFDFNPPIVTNIFNTEFVASLGVAEFDNADFTAYPNPASNSITVSLKKGTGTIDTVSVNDVLGKMIQSDVVHNRIAVIDLSKLSQGIYFLKIQSEGKEKVMKVVKQ